MPKPKLTGEVFRLEEFLPYRLSVAANRVSRLFARRYSEAYGLSIPEWRVLAMIGRFGTLSPSAVGEWTAMDKVKVSRAAASLVARGLLRQTQDPRDGRGRLLHLTRKGATVYQGVVPLACEL
ncbi:MAG TPA: MarR family transcriptional regulator, partial [Acetobacteraceae bacterium]|nr:MarR family transcriptional regulator [Acetobacteraceae bacterium]